MRWSFSRLNSYYNCPYAWHMQYIECQKGEDNFYSQYGKFMHEILEKYAKGNLSIFEISQYYEENFDEAVSMGASYNKYVDIKQSYYNKGLDYLNNIDLILENYTILGVEKEVKFKIKDYEMVGFIDLLLKDKNDNIIVLDHKSASIKFLKNGNVSKGNIEHVEEFKRQLYLYSIAIKNEYGVFPKLLQWNLFKDRNWMSIDFNEDDYNKAIQWAEDTILQIEKEELWLPKSDYFYCHNLCSFRNAACEYKP